MWMLFRSPSFAGDADVKLYDQLRNVLDIPVPEIVAWSVPGQTNDV